MCFLGKSAIVAPAVCGSKAYHLQGLRTRVYLPLGTLTTTDIHNIPAHHKYTCIVTLLHAFRSAGSSYLCIVHSCPVYKRPRSEIGMFTSEGCQAIRCRGILIYLNCGDQFPAIAACQLTSREEVAYQYFGTTSSTESAQFAYLQPCAGRGSRHGYLAYWKSHLPHQG